MTKKEALRIRILGNVLFIMYMILMIYFLFFSERYGRKSPDEAYRYNLTLFKEIKRFWEARSVIGWRISALNLAGNVAAFIPFGAILPVLNKRMRHFFRIAALGMVVSLIVEVIQLLTRVGSFDVDDILLNTIGTAAGYGIFAVCNHIRLAGERKRAAGDT